MEASEKKTGAISQDDKGSTLPVGHIVKHIWYIVSGSIVTVLWLALFVGGLMVNSSYYRTAVNYGFADVSDWIWVILTFTVSNVAVLAFFSGLLGGIISKLRATEGFTISEKAFATKKEGVGNKSIQVENPFISAVRGMFVFLAILLMQYVSSFNDLGSIGKTGDAKQEEVKVNYEQLYTKLSKPALGDSVMQKEIRKAIEEQIAFEAGNRSDSALVSRIFILKENLSYLKMHAKSASDSAEIRKIEIETGMLRRMLKPPPDADFSQVGISSFSYFKFAVIVSFLAFIFGYDASKFAAFLGNMPIFKPSNPDGSES